MAFRSLFLLGIVAFGLIWTESLRGQTCSCAGAPLISTQSRGTSSAGNLVLGLTYQYNEISSTYSGSTRLNDDIASRSTQSLLLELNYGITNRLSLSTTFSFVNKIRTTGRQNAGLPTTLTARGLGDGVLLFRYAIAQQGLWNPIGLAIGAGAKAPLGQSSLTNNGLPLNADMQPGTGAWDGVLWSFASTALNRARTQNLFWTNSYRQTSANERFTGTDRYRFGNEWTSTLGIGGTLVGQILYSAQLRYRTTRSDRLNGFDLPNTGGKWLFFQPSVTAGINKNVAVSIRGNIPIRQHLNGTQPSTTFTVGASLFINLNQREDGFSEGDPRTE